MAKKIDFEDRISTYPIGLSNSQIKWLDDHPEFKIHKFFRDKLEEYIKLREIKKDDRT